MPKGPWIAPPTDDEFYECYIKVVTFLARGEGDDITPEEFQVEYPISPQGMTEHADRVVTEHMESFQGNPAKFLDPDNWRALYVLGLLTGIEMTRRTSANES